MTWPFKRRRQPPHNPRIVFELVGGSDVHVSCDWPDHDDVETKVGLAKTFVSMVMAVCDGDLLPNVEQAVAVTGRLKGDERLSELMLRLIVDSIEHRTLENMDSEDEYEGGPAIGPDEVFRLGD